MTFRGWGIAQLLQPWSLLQGRHPARAAKGTSRCDSNEIEMATLGAPSMRFCSQQTLHTKAMLRTSTAQMGARRSMRCSAWKNVSQAARAQQQGASITKAGLTAGSSRMQAAVQRSRAARMQITAQRRHAPAEVMMLLAMTMGQAPRQAQKQRRSRQPRDMPRRSKPTAPERRRAAAREAQQAQSKAKRATALAQRRSLATETAPLAAAAAVNSAATAACAGTATHRRPEHAEKLSVKALCVQHGSNGALKRVSKKRRQASGKENIPPETLLAAAGEAHMTQSSSQHVEGVSVDHGQISESTPLAAQGGEPSDAPCSSNQSTQQQGSMQGEDLAAADWESLSDDEDDFMELATKIDREFGPTSRRSYPEAAAVQRSIPGQFPSPLSPLQGFTGFVRAKRQKSSAHHERIPTPRSALTCQAQEEAGSVETLGATLFAQRVLCCRATEEEKHGKPFSKGPRYSKPPGSRLSAMSLTSSPADEAPATEPTPQEDCASQGGGSSEANASMAAEAATRQQQQQPLTAMSNESFPDMSMEEEDLAASEVDSPSDDEEDFGELAARFAEEFGGTTPRIRPEVNPVQQSIPGLFPVPSCPLPGFTGFVKAKRQKPITQHERIPTPRSALTRHAQEKAGASETVGSTRFAQRVLCCRAMKGDRDEKEVRRIPTYIKPSGSRLSAMSSASSPPDEAPTASAAMEAAPQQDCASHGEGRPEAMAAPAAEAATGQQQETALVLEPGMCGMPPDASEQLSHSSGQCSMQTAMSRGGLPEQSMEAEGSASSEMESAPIDGDDDILMTQIGEKSSDTTPRVCPEAAAVQQSSPGALQAEVATGRQQERTLQHACQPWKGLSEFTRNAIAQAGRWQGDGEAQLARRLLLSRAVRAEDCKAKVWELPQYRPPPCSRLVAACH